jgi:hypothetical protein
MLYQQINSFCSNLQLAWFVQVADVLIFLDIWEFVHREVCDVQLDITAGLSSGRRIRQGMDVTLIIELLGLRHNPTMHQRQ